MDFLLVILSVVISYLIAARLFKPGKPDPFRNYDND